MTNGDLATAYLKKATIRLDILPVLFDQEAYSDVVREAQEIVELALKGMLRYAAIEAPRWHDLSGVLRPTHPAVPGRPPDADRRPR